MVDATARLRRLSKQTVAKVQLVIDHLVRTQLTSDVTVKFLQKPFTWGEKVHEIIETFGAGAPIVICMVFSRDL